MINLPFLKLIFEYDKEIGVSPHTVATFIKRIYEKLRLFNAPQP